MNEGQPVLPFQDVRSLVDSRGSFRNGWALLSRYPILSRSQLEDEWRAQIGKFIADTGRYPSHLDFHCHYPYVFPAWFRLSVDLAQAYGRIPVRVPFDDALEQKAADLAARYTGFPAWFVVWQGRRYRSMVDERALARTEYWESGFSQDGARTTDHLLDILDRLPEGVTELLCHPGMEGWRAQDYAALKEAVVMERIEALGIELVGYRWVAERQGGGGEGDVWNVEKMNPST
jgi:predicted glycoside hydrolase/deacetylase ChbG (UPF0249 family)